MYFLQIPLSSRLPKDKLSRNVSKTGRSSIRTTCHLIMEKRTKEQVVLVKIVSRSKEVIRSGDEHFEVFYQGKPRRRILDLLDTTMCKFCSNGVETETQDFTKCVFARVHFPNILAR